MVINTKTINGVGVRKHDPCSEILWRASYFYFYRMIILRHWPHGRKEKRKKYVGKADITMVRYSISYHRHRDMAKENRVMLGALSNRYGEKAEVTL